MSRPAKRRRVNRKGKGLAADLGKKALITLTPIVVKAIAGFVGKLFRKKRKNSGKGLITQRTRKRRRQGSGIPFPEPSQNALFTPRPGLRNLGSGVTIPRTGTGLRRAGDGHGRRFLIQPQGVRLGGRDFARHGRRAGGRGFLRSKGKQAIRGLSAKQKKILQAIQ